MSKENFNINDPHNTLLMLGGLFQKVMNVKQVHYVLDTLNQRLLAEPLSVPNFLILTTE